ncbi:MAG TPA: hypothetical protein VFM54_24435 [Micromonosporaceae bacterium]|nr:hypothetical protein [Micromonosporaceae bacterium]
MVSAFERHAVQRLVDKATDLGVEVPGAVSGIVHISHAGSAGARLWAEQHPDDDRPPCCYSSVDGHDRCTCWVPVWNGTQRPPRPPRQPEDVCAQRRMCGDCAFRKDSPERAEGWREEALFDLARGGTPFWCHQGMRQPVRWEHPDGRTVPGDPADWQPPMASGIPYQLDGSPGLLCAGWVAHAARAAEEGDSAT